MIVYIQHNGEQIAVDVAPDATVRDLISAAIDVGLPRTAQILVGGQQLDDRATQLSDLGISDEAQLTASIRSSFEDSAEFEIDGAFATLKSSSDHGTICFAHKTSVGQESMMRLRIWNGAPELWAQDTSRLHAYTEQQVFHIHPFASVGVSLVSVGELSVEVKAKQQNNIWINYKDSCWVGYGLSLQMAEEICNIHRITEQSQVQICVRLKRECVGIPATIEFVDFELLE